VGSIVRPADRAAAGVGGPGRSSAVCGESLPWAFCRDRRIRGMTAEECRCSMIDQAWLAESWLAQPQSVLPCECSGLHTRLKGVSACTVVCLARVSEREMSPHAADLRLCVRRWPMRAKVLVRDPILCPRGDSGTPSCHPCARQGVMCWTVAALTLVDQCAELTAPTTGVGMGRPGHELAAMASSTGTSAQHPPRRRRGWLRCAYEEAPDTNGGDRGIGVSAGPARSCTHRWSYPDRPNRTYGGVPHHGLVGRNAAYVPPIDRRSVRPGGRKITRATSGGCLLSQWCRREAGISTAEEPCGAARCRSG
jgi:hypothetical protein